MVRGRLLAYVLLAAATSCGGGSSPAADSVEVLLGGDPKDHVVGESCELDIYDRVEVFHPDEGGALRDDETRIGVIPAGVARGSVMEDEESRFGFGGIICAVSEMFSLRESGGDTVHAHVGWSSEDFAPTEASVGDVLAITVPIEEPEREFDFATLGLPQVDQLADQLVELTLVVLPGTAYEFAADDVRRWADALRSARTGVMILFAPVSVADAADAASVSPGRIASELAFEALAPAGYDAAFVLLVTERYYVVGSAQNAGVAQKFSNDDVDAVVQGAMRNATDIVRGLDALVASLVEKLSGAAVSA